MVSFDSAKGPSETTRFLPETILPCGSSGLPATALPSSFNPLNHSIHRSAICCICSGERPWYQSVPRNISMYPLFEFVCVFIMLLCPWLNALLARLYDERGKILRTIISLLDSPPKSRRCCSPCPGR